MRETIIMVWCQAGPTVRVSLREGRQVKGKLLAADGNGIRLKTDDGTMQTISWPDISELAPLLQPPQTTGAEQRLKPKWVISIQPKASLTEGTQSQQTLGGQIAARRSDEASPRPFCLMVVTPSLAKRERPPLGRTNMTGTSLTKSF